MEQIAHIIPIDTVRLEASRQLDPARKAQFGQFMTPAGIAGFMVSLFSVPEGDIRLLDAGAGVGSLTSAFLDTHLHQRIDVHAWEIDRVLRGYLVDTLQQHEQQAEKRGVSLHVTIYQGDFIEDAVRNLLSGKGARFTHAILNPPYKKINQNSGHRLLLRKVGIETVNLYTAFVALCILLMETHGEIVAIIPRSFCNGTYYRPFRELLLKHCAIRHIHLFESRKKAFKDDEVLQENIIIHLEKGAPQGTVTISTSHDSRFDDYGEQIFPFTDIVKPKDPESFIHIPTVQRTEEASCLFSHTLKDIGLEVCTGPVVDFRVKDFWQRDPRPGTVPLLYPHHFANGKLSYPKEHKKPNALAFCSETEKWLMPSGFYVLVKRFSAKEERRRVVAYVLDPAEIPAPLYGFENHWNVFHVRKQGLDELTARGLACFLNSTMLDEHFRVFSGHTQVNATDLRSMKYPSREQLKELGSLAGKRPLAQKEIDQLVTMIEEKSGHEASLQITNIEGLRADNGKQRRKNSGSSQGSSRLGDAKGTTKRKKRTVSSSVAESH
jgi:adenine-specific DNA-methyltransferase